MAMRIAMISAAGLVLAGCGPDAGSTGRGAAPVPQPDGGEGLPADRFAGGSDLEQLWKALPPELRSRLAERKPTDRSKPGRYRDSSFASCTDYLTRAESEDFCSSAVPEDWTSFEFEGETYYVQPLARAGR